MIDNKLTHWPAQHVSKHRGFAGYYEHAVQCWKAKIWLPPSERTPAPAARCGRVSAAGARNAAARERWVPSFRFRRLPRRMHAATGRERLDRRSLKAPRHAAAAPARRRARNHA